MQNGQLNRVEDEKKDFGTNLFGESGKLALFGDDVGRAEFQVGYEVLADGLVLRQRDRAEQRQERPVA